MVQGNGRGSILQGQSRIRFLIQSQDDEGILIGLEVWGSLVHIETGRITSQLHEDNLFVPRTLPADAQV